MRLRTAVVVSLAAILILLLHTCAFAASTCWLNGRLAIHHTCAARTVTLWVWVCVDIETNVYDWVMVGQRTLMNNETFSFLVNCGPDCFAPAMIKGGGDTIHEFDLPGRGNTRTWERSMIPTTAPRYQNRLCPTPISSGRVGPGRNGT